MIKIETKRLFLRKWALSDCTSLVCGLNNYTIADNFGTRFPYTEEDAIFFINDAIQKNKPKFAIVLKENSQVIGGCGLHFIDQHVSCSIWISVDYQSLGYGTEALQALVNYGFGYLGISQIKNSFFEGNLSSKRMHEKVGFEVADTQTSYDTKYRRNRITTILMRISSQ